MSGAGNEGPPAGTPALSRPERGEGQGVAEWVFGSIKDDVLTGRLRPDDVLVEGTLATHFGVSRGPAREALQRLRRTGLVRAVPRLGYIVTGVGLRDYDEVFQIRIALEPLATELATARVTRGLADWRRLDDLAQQSLPFVTDTTPGRGPRMARLNHEFHHEIAVMSGNRRLATAVDGVLDELERVLILVAYDLSALAEMTDDHTSLLRAIRGGDPAAAGDLMRTQLSHAYKLMRNLAVSDGIGGPVHTP